MYKTLTTPKLCVEISIKKTIETQRHSDYEFTEINFRNIAE